MLTTIGEFSLKLSYYQLGMLCNTPRRLKTNDTPSYGHFLLTLILVLTLNSERYACALCTTWSVKYTYTYLARMYYYLFFYNFFSDRLFVSSAWSFVFFIPATTANDLRLRRIFYPIFYPLHLLSYLNS